MGPVGRSWRLTWEYSAIDRSASSHPLVHSREHIAVSPFSLFALSPSALLSQRKWGRSEKSCGRRPASLGDEGRPRPAAPRSRRTLKRERLGPRPFFFHPSPTYPPFLLPYSLLHSQKMTAWTKCVPFFLFELWAKAACSAVPCSISPPNLSI